MTPKRRARGFRRSTCGASMARDGARKALQGNGGEIRLRRAEQAPATAYGLPSGFRIRLRKSFVEQPA